MIHDERNFVERLSREYFCPVSFAVLLEPYQTQCCGNHLSEEAYQQLQGRACPVCRENNLTAVKDKYLKRKVLSLRVRCPHRAESCRWEGELGGLERHIMVQHKSQQLPMPGHSRACQYCKSYPQLKDEVCRLKDKIKQQEDQIKQQGDQIKLQMEEIKKQQNQQQVELNYQVENFKQKLEQQGIQRLLSLRTPPVDMVMDSFRERKIENNVWYSPPFYSHLGGYKMCLMVDANGQGDGAGTHVSVYVHLMRGEFDDRLKWPFRGNVTIQLHSKRDDFEQMISLNMNRPWQERGSGLGFPEYIPHQYLYSGGFNYNNCLKFCVSSVLLKSSF